jgi:hypothetical protein
MDFKKSGVLRLCNSTRKELTKSRVARIGSSRARSISKLLPCLALIQLIAGVHCQESGEDGIMADIEKQLGFHRCKAGQYDHRGIDGEDSSAAAKCSDCPAGYYQTHSGVVWYQICFKCSLGQYQPNTAETSCAFCPAGQIEERSLTHQFTS